MNRTTNKAATHVRWMIRRDMADVHEIEDLSFGEHAWNEDDFIRSLRQRNCIGMVAEVGERIAGYMIYELHKSRLELLNFAVHPNYRSEGVAAIMLAKLVGKLSTERRNRFCLEIGENNLNGQQFFRYMGFRAINVIRDKWGTGEDAYRMVYTFQRGDK